MKVFMNIVKGNHSEANQIIAIAREKASGIRKAISVGKGQSQER
jgi:hypothetical protein